MIKPFLSDKGSKGSKITLVDDNFFKSAVDSLGIEENKFLLENTDDLRDLGDSIDIAIKKFDRHLQDIKENISLSSSFNFSYVTKSDIEEEITNLNINKQVRLITSQLNI